MKRFVLFINIVMNDITCLTQNGVKALTVRAHIFIHYLHEYCIQ